MRKAGPANEVSALGLRVHRQRCYRRESAFLEVPFDLNDWFFRIPLQRHPNQTLNPRIYPKTVPRPW